MSHHHVAGLVLGTPDVATGRRPLHAYLWPAGMVLAELVVGELAGEVRGRRVIELGCGLGAVGLAAARAGGDVLLTDAAADALGWRRPTPRPTAIAVMTRVLEWGRVPESMIGGFDVVLGSDITYGRDELVPLVGAIAALLAPGGVPTSPIRIGCARPSPRRRCRRRSRGPPSPDRDRATAGTDERCQRRSACPRVSARPNRRKDAPADRERQMALPSKAMMSSTSGATASGRNEIRIGCGRSWRALRARRRGTHAATSRHPRARH